jgi:hypothetical protein
VSQIQSTQPISCEKYFKHGDKDITKSRQIKKYLQKVVYKKGGMEFVSEGVFFSGRKWHIEVSKKEDDSVMFKMIDATKNAVYWVKVKLREARNIWNIRKHQGINLMDDLVQN